MFDQDSEAKKRIMALNKECAEIAAKWHSVAGAKEFSEEDTKLKLIFPLFEILGWNMKDYRETEAECSEYDETINQELTKKWSSSRQQGVKADCVFKLENKPYICLEAKHLSQRILPSLDNLSGQRTIAYSQKWGAKHVVFTNYLRMIVVELNKATNEPLVIANFQNTNEYVSEYDKLKTLAKPENVEHKTG